MASAETRDGLLLPHRGRRIPASRSSGTGLPADLLSQSAERLSTLALLYAFTFFMAGFFPSLLFEADRRLLFGSLFAWVPGLTAISVALLVAAIVRSGRLSVPAVMIVGLVFEVASSYGIAAAEFFDPLKMKDYITFLGLSWVAVWTLLFTVVVPTRPRRAVVAALASVSSVPVIIAIGMVTVAPSFRPHPLQFFFWFIWLLTGQLVFTGETPFALVMHHAHTPPTAPSARSETPIPRALEDLVLACLAKNPADRPQSARELSRRLGAINFGRTWTDEKAREWWSQHEPARSDAGL